jgi:diguanylate cyclase
MNNEASCYSGVAGRAFAHTIIDELGDGGVAPTPPNYEVWSSYRSGAFPDLNREIETRLGAGEALSAALCEEWFERYFTATRSFDQLLQTGESIANELNSALAHLRDASADAGKYAGELETVASVMEETTAPSAVQVLVRRLINETRTVATRNRVLESRIDASSKQMETLQASVRQATLEAVTDGLTGLANRRHFDRVLARQVREAAEAGHSLCLIMCDIDHFKQVNDTWGHGVGDQVIRYVATTLRALAPPTALAARYGGEEYALLLPATNPAAAQAVAQELCERVRTRSLSRKSSGDIIGVVTVSSGVASLERGEAGESLVKRADACLYEAKRTGRNRVVTDLASQPALTEQSMRRASQA